MATKKITDLTELTTAASGDVLPIVDIDLDITKKIQISNFPISTATQMALDNKQDNLVSGTNIKTINSTSLLGSGDISISVNTGILQTVGGVPIDSTLRQVEDQSGNLSPLYLSTSGVNALGSGIVSTQLGANANASGTASTSLGFNSDATASLSIGIGRSSLASGSNSISIGAYSNATQTDSIAMGNTAQAIHTESVAIGKNATTTAANQLAIGSSTENLGTITSESVTSDATWTVNINGTDYKILLKA